MMKIMIDPGHGGTDSGAVGGGYLEKDIVLEASLAIGERLRECGADVAYTRTTDIPAGQVHERGKSAKGCDYLLSIHCNGGVPSANGAEVWCQGGEAFAQTESRFADYLSPLIRWRGVKSKKYTTGDEVMRPYDGKRCFTEVHSFSDYYGVLRGAESVGVSADLLELFFITNPDDLSVYLARKREFWEGIVRAVCESFSLAYAAPEEPDYKALYEAAEADRDAWMGKYYDLLAGHNALEADHTLVLREIAALASRWPVE